MARRPAPGAALNSSPWVGNASARQRAVKRLGDGDTPSHQNHLCQHARRGWPPCTCAPNAIPATSASNAARIVSDFANGLVQEDCARTATNQSHLLSSSPNRRACHSTYPQACSFPQRRGSPAPPPQESYYGGVSLPTPEISLTGGPYLSIEVGRSPLSKPQVVDPGCT